MLFVFSLSYLFFFLFYVSNGTHMQWLCRIVLYNIHMYVLDYMVWFCCVISRVNHILKTVQHYVHIFIVYREHQLPYRIPNSNYFRFIRRRRVSRIIPFFVFLSLAFIFMCFFFFALNFYISFFLSIFKLHV